MKQIDQLPQLINAGNDDVIPIQSVNGVTSKIAKKDLIYGIPTRTNASDNDWVISQDSTTGELYKIKVIDFLPSSVPNLPRWVDLALNEISGSTATDTSGNNRNGTYNNVALSAAGVILNGSSRISLNSPNDFFNPLTVGIEFKTNTASLQGLWEFRNTQDLSGGSFAPALRLNPTGQIGLYGFPNSTGYSSNTYNDNNWHKAIAVITASTAKIYVDQVLVVSFSGATTVSFNGFFSIGATKASGNFTGQLKKFRIWNSELTEAQAIALSK